MAAATMVRRSLFDQLGGTTIQGSIEHGFRLRVLVAGPRVTPRHKMFEYWLELGREDVVKILKHKSFGLGKDDKLNLLFVFPERFMSVHEKHLFIQRLQTHRQRKRIQTLDIITQEPLIVNKLKSEALGAFDISPKDPEAGLAI